MGMDEKVFTDCPISESSSESKGILQFKFAHIFSGCIASAFYGFDKNGDVIEKFAPTYSQYLDTVSTEVDMYDLSFTINDIETLVCASEEIDCKDDKKCTKYSCNYGMHFYYDYAKTFATKQE